MMKVAFVGKGGSGKTSIASIFTRFIMQKEKNFVFFDADINMHASLLLGVLGDKTKILSNEDNVFKIRNFLLGENKKIVSPNHFVKTTPPGIGSNLITFDKGNFLLDGFGKKLGNFGYFLEVGTYEKDLIGKSCYHTNLSILENILTHFNEKNDEWIIVDMVAGTDAFSNTFHLLFDRIVFVLEASLESIDVYKKYIELAKHAGVSDKIVLVLNKEEEGDLDYVLENDILVDFKFPYSKDLKMLSRKGEISFSLEFYKELEKLKNFLSESEIDKDTFLKSLHKLHLEYSSQDYIVKTLGDLSSQIDEDFTYN